MRLRLVISAAIAAVATYSAIVRDARRQSLAGRPAPRTGGPVARERRGAAVSRRSEEGQERAYASAVPDSRSAEPDTVRSTTSAATLPVGPASGDEGHPVRRASARWQALPPAPVPEHLPHEPVVAAGAPGPTADAPVRPDAPVTVIGADEPGGSADAPGGGSQRPADAAERSVPPDVPAEAASRDEPATSRGATDAPEAPAGPTTDGAAHAETQDEAPAAEPVPMGGFSRMDVEAASASDAGTVMASGEFTISGTSHGPGQGTITAVTYRRPLDDAASSSDIRLEVNHAVNVAPQGLFVLGDEGFAPNGDGFVLMLLAAESGAFSARGTYRVYA